MKIVLVIDQFDDANNGTTHHQCPAVCHGP